MSALRGRIGIVVGASSGIGRAAALRLAAEGAELYLVGRARDRLEESCQAIRSTGGTAHCAPLDATDEHALRDLVSRVASRHGALHIMVNGAGVEHIGTVADGDPVLWREMFEVNVMSLLVGSQAAIRAMRGTGSSGHIVHFGSIAARTDNTGVYGATKAAVHALTSTLRKELETDPIRVVNIIPGAVLTNFVRHFPEELMNGFLASHGFDGDFRRGEVYTEDRIAQIQRRARDIVCSADDVARAVLFAVTQPPEVNIYELFVRPARNFS